MALSEADTRAKLIDPAIYAKGWSEDLICRETTLGAVEIIGGKARRRAGGRTDYTLRVRVSQESQPVAVALIEAKKDTLPPGHGLDQAKGYQRCQRSFKTPQAWSLKTPHPCRVRDHQRAGGHRSVMAAGPQPSCRAMPRSLAFPAPSSI